MAVRASPVSMITKKCLWLTDKGGLRGVNANIARPFPLKFLGPLVDSQMGPFPSLALGD